MKGPGLLAVHHHSQGFSRPDESLGGGIEAKGFKTQEGWWKNWYLLGNLPRKDKGGVKCDKGVVGLDPMLSLVWD